MLGLLEIPSSPPEEPGEVVRQQGVQPQQMLLKMGPFKTRIRLNKGCRVYYSRVIDETLRRYYTANYSDRDINRGRGEDDIFKAMGLWIEDSE